MSSTFVDFRGQGFEANDSALEVWLALVVDEIRALDHVPDWLAALRDRWEELATMHSRFGVQPALDEVAEDDAHRAALVELSTKALARLRSMGTTLPKAALNRLRDWGEGGGFAVDVPADIFVRTGDYFTRLLAGTLAREEDDARS